MAEHVYRRWTPPIETRLTDIHGWLVDMHAAKEFAEKLRIASDNENSDPVVVDALSTAALVRYSRCFTCGSRERLRIEQLVTATPNEIDLHDWLRGVRDWHIAHPVNLQEVHALYLIVDPSPEATSGALGISSFSSTNLALSPPYIDATERLCGKWIEWLTPQLIAENQKLVPLTQQLTRAEVLALPSDEPEPVSNIKARRRQSNAR